MEGPLQAIVSKHSPSLNLLESNDTVKQYLQDINHQILEVQV